MGARECSNQQESKVPATADTAELEFMSQRLRVEESFTLAVVAGILAAVLGAFLWAGVTVVSGYQIGFMAIGIGVLVAFSIRFAGKGLSIKFQILGAVLSLFGCVVGNCLTVCYFLAQNEGVGFSEVLTMINPSAIPSLMISAFSPMDMLFYGIAVYEGYRLSLRHLPEAELYALQCFGASSSAG